MVFMDNRYTLDDVVIVVPTCRPDRIELFKKAWRTRYPTVSIVIVHDGDRPYIEHVNNSATTCITIDEVMGQYVGAIYNHSDCVRNLGFAYVAKSKSHKVVLSLDDDVEPEYVSHNDNTISQHLAILGKSVSKYRGVIWMNSGDLSNDLYMRGHPYRYDEADRYTVALSHGVWSGVPDLDAMNQLIMLRKYGSNIYPDIKYTRCIVPPNVLIPICAMNMAFTLDIVKDIYQAPMAIDGYDRFADIWGGVSCQMSMWGNNYLVATGYASARHTRASDVYVNLNKECKGIKVNDGYIDPVYSTKYSKAREIWGNFIDTLL